jgi:GTP pyrophosphokinase
LHNGDIVDIITQKNCHPSLDWLNFVGTSAAKYRIKQWYKRSRREENIARGRDLLEKELGKTGFENLLKSEAMQTVAEKCNYHSVEDLLASLGYGEVTLNLVLNRWREVVKGKQPVTDMIPFLAKELTAKTSRPEKTDLLSTYRASDSPIIGVEGLVYHIAGCCTPIPGEAIVGAVTRGRGISIHRQGCHNLDHVEYERLVPVRWNSVTESQNRPYTYPVNMQIEALDRVGVLKDVLSRLSDQGINVRHAQVKTSLGEPALIDLGIDVRDCSQLERLFVQLRKMSDIINIRRVCEADDCG